jgi:hypothetical protein
MDKMQALINSDRCVFTAYNLRYDVRSYHPHFVRICELVRAGKPRAAIGLYRDGLKKVHTSGFVTKNGYLSYKGHALSQPFSDMYGRILEDRSESGIAQILRQFAAQPHQPPQYELCRIPGKIQDCDH